MIVAVEPHNLRGNLIKLIQVFISVSFAQIPLDFSDVKLKVSGVRVICRVEAEMRIVVVPVQLVRLYKLA